MTQEVVDRLLVPIQTTIFTTEPPVTLFSGAIQDPQGDLEKHSIFKPVSKAEKLRKAAPRASKRHRKSTLESLVNVFCGNMVFAIPSMRKPRFGSPKCPDFDQEIGVENGMEPNLETTPNFLPLVPEKLSEWGPKSC